MSFITSPGVIVPPLTAGGAAYGTGSQAKVNSAGTVGQVLTSAGAGVPTWATPASVSYPITVPLGGTGLTTLTANNVILGNGTSTPTFVAPGTSGNVLKSNGTTWQSTALASGGLTLLQTVTASAAATASITGISSTYDNYVIYGDDIFGSTNAVQMQCQLTIGGTLRNTGYLWTVNKSSGGSILYTGLGGSNTTYGGLSDTNTISSLVGRAFNFKMDLIGINQTSSFKYVKSYAADTSNNVDSTSTIWWTGGGGALSQVDFLLSTGNVTGTFYLFGIAKV